MWDSTVGELQADRQRLIQCDANLNLVMERLPHLQDGIDKMVEQQHQTNLILAEQSGFLRGILESTKTTAATSA